MTPSSITHRAVLFSRALTMSLILAGLVSIGAPTRASTMVPQCRFDPAGYFYIKGGSPQGFEELNHITVSAYYRGAPNVQGKRLQVGDLVRFELPSEPQRHGILLWDLKGLRFRE